VIPAIGASTTGGTTSMGPSRNGRVNVDRDIWPSCQLSRPSSWS
jgi:hypothetical protein